MRDGVGHLREGRFVDVGDRVAGSVAAGVGRLTGGSPEGSSLSIGLRLDPTAEQAAGGDTGVDERAVVRVAIKVDRRPGQPFAVEVRGEERGERIGTFSGGGFGIDEPDRIG